ncbi:MAG: TetR family transcriptional regulator, partial [Nocardioidaceae bacterium]|nr:TetR family transcriptional regulator [Nocardioidaceae bacterium]
MKRLLAFDPNWLRTNSATVDGVPQPVKVRAYRSVLRTEQAAATRRQVLRAARELFTRQGYADTTVAAVAARARVSVDTIYASVGRKPQLMLAVID